MSKEEKAYWNHEVSKILSVGESTLRKWCLALEKNGYTFIRGKKDSRAFTQHDITSLTYFKDLTKVENQTIDQAAKIVAERFGERIDSEGTTPVMSDETSSLDEISKDIKELLMISREQVELNQVLLKKLADRDSIIESQFRYIERLNEERTLIETRENDEHLATVVEKKKRPIERIKSFFKR